MGVSAGTAALQQAAEAFRAGVSVDEYARSHEELRLALNQ
jgi:ribulose 1,5-bisphosphate carboxylase large subunit-like protein